MKVRIMVGLPRSGKTTKAKEIVADGVIVDCDRIREMLTGSDTDKGFRPKNEKIVWSVFEDLWKKSLSLRRDVVIANTNCNLNILKEFVREIELYSTALNLDTQIEFHIVDTPIGVIMGRAQKMPEIIPIIKRMAEGYKEVKLWIEESGYPDFFYGKFENKSEVEKW
jgi:predicted kinase